MIKNWVTSFVNAASRLGSTVITQFEHSYLAITKSNLFKKERRTRISTRYLLGQSVSILLLIFPIEIAFKDERRHRKTHLHSSHLLRRFVKSSLQTKQFADTTQQEETYLASVMNSFETEIIQSARKTEKREIKMWKRTVFSGSRYLRPFWHTRPSKR